MEFVLNMLAAILFAMATGMVNGNEIESSTDAALECLNKNGVVLVVIDTPEEIADGGHATCFMPTEVQ